MIIICFTGHRNRVCDPAFLDMVKNTWNTGSDDLWIHGGAEGFDTQVDKYARTNGIPVEVVRPEYHKYATSTYAPIARNHQMIDRATMIVACWDGRVVGGTFDTVKYAIKRGKLVIVIPAKKG